MFIQKIINLGNPIICSVHAQFNPDWVVSVSFLFQFLSVVSVLSFTALVRRFPFPSFFLVASLFLLFFLFFFVGNFCWEEVGIFSSVGFDESQRINGQKSRADRSI